MDDHASVLDRISPSFLRRCHIVIAVIIIIVVVVVVVIVIAVTIAIAISTVIVVIAGDIDIVEVGGMVASGLKL